MECAKKTSPVTQWSIITGQDFREVFFVKENGLPKDLTDYSFKMDIRTDAIHTAPLIISLETGDGITVDPLIGKIELFIDNTVTKASPILDNVKKKGYFDLFMIPTVGDNLRLLYGTIPIIGGTTDV